jgi:hypothetical protein
MSNRQELRRHLQFGTVSALDTVTRVVRGVIWLVVAILVLHSLLLLFGASPTNSFATFIRNWASTLSLGLGDVLTVPTQSQASAASFGIAAVIWLVIMAVVVGLLRRVAGAGWSGRGGPTLVARRGLEWLAGAVTLVSWLLVLLLALYIVFVAGQANLANPWTGVVSTWAERLNLGLGHLFTLPDPRVTVLVNYGIAAIIWLIIGRVVSWCVQRVARP